MNSSGRRRTADSAVRYARDIILGHLGEFSRRKKGVLQSGSVEDLHQLRVTSRRLRNDLSVFKDLFGPKHQRRWKKSFKSITRSAGPGRDLDVKILFIKGLISGRVQSKNKIRRAGFKKIKLLLDSERRRCQSQIKQVIAEFDRKRIEQEIRRTLGNLLSETSPSPEGELSKMARRKSLRSLKKLRTLRRYVHQPQNISGLHRMRIAAKKLRYTLEVFEKFYGSGTRQYIRAVMTLQGHLGDIHDFDVWKNSLADITSGGPIDESSAAAVEYLNQRYDSLKSAAYRKFATRWDLLERRKSWDQLCRFLKRKRSGTRS